MFGRSPPNILATLAVCFIVLLNIDKSPTLAKPYPQQNLRKRDTAGNIRTFDEGDWSALVNYENGHHITRDKRSPMELEDETPNGDGKKTVSVNADKRQGIETPIQPLGSDLKTEGLSGLNIEESVRSKVNQPRDETVGVSVEEEKKSAESTVTDTSTAQHQQEKTAGVSSEENQLNEANKSQENGHVENNGANEDGKVKDQPLSSGESQSGSRQAAQGDRTANGAAEADSRSPLDFNVETRSFPGGINKISKLANIPNDTISTKPLGSFLAVGNRQSSSAISGTNQHLQESKTSIKDSVNKQVADGKASTESSQSKPTTLSTNTATPNADAPLKTAAQEPAVQAQTSPQEKAPTTTVPQVQSLPVEPVRDTLGNSGSEIATTHAMPEMYSYTERDTEPKPSNGPEVGHFQVDDKSADLEINANSAGVKVKAKPASLQVVSRPGSHAPPPILPVAQERSLYRYPPYHHHHHWFPGMRRSYAHFHGHHFPRAFRSFAERRRFEPFYDEPPFFGRHMNYWYPHRHRHHYHDSDLFERSRMEEPEEYPKYRHGRRHKRRFRHMHGPPYRRQFFNNIPIMNGMDTPQMGMLPEEGTVPQLPIGAEQPTFGQRQNIVTPMPPPINVMGNPPAGLIGGMNTANLGMNGLGGLNAFNGMNELNGINGLSGMNGMNDINGMNPIGLNSFGEATGLGALGTGLNGGLGGMVPLGSIPGSTRALGTRNVNPVIEGPRRAFKKTAILSGKKTTGSKDSKQVNYSKEEPKKDALKEHKESPLNVGKKKKDNVNLKSWEKTLKRYHRLNVFTSKSHDSHQYRRSTNSKAKKSNTEKNIKSTQSNNTVQDLHPQNYKDTKANRKNSIVMHRPPIIYHPPPEIYHRPDIVVHRAPIMLHRPPIVYHQPPVVVHRPAIIYHQPPIVFHQPPPMVHQPVLHSHDTWVTKPVVYHTASMVSHAKTFYGIPSHVFSGNYGEGCHGAHCPYRKGHVPHRNDTASKDKAHSRTSGKGKAKRDSYTDYLAYFTSLWKQSRRNKRNADSEYDYITSSEGAKEKLSYTEIDAGEVDKRETVSDYNEYLYNTWSPKFKRDSGIEDNNDSKDGFQKKKKKDVVVNRPPIIYHPPPEIYHRPDIVVHRPPLVIHRPPIIYHQPPVIVHRPAVVYHQPPIVFHQPPPAVSQPLLYSHDSFTVHPAFYASHHGSVVRDFGHYVGMPNVITNYGSPLFGKAPPMGKRSKIATPVSSENATSSQGENATKTSSVKDSLHKSSNDSNEKAGKKNTVVVSRPPIIYHPPPEIYHRPVIVVHRPPIMIHRAPIFYHQPPVVVHRPAIVYHQPPLVFHQPPPMVHQPILNSRDTWVSHHVVVPYASRVTHHHTYIGVPDAYTIRHYGGRRSFAKSHILASAKSKVEKASPRDDIVGEKNKTVTQKDAIDSHHKKHNVKESLKIKKTANRKGGKKNAVIVRRPPIVYHPPPEIYHRPEIIVHRAPIMIHRAPIIYHQPPVIVHRPAIVYHQPALIFHQPMPVVHQPVLKSHDTYVPRPVVKLFRSRLHHAGHVYHIPHAYYHGHGGIHFLAYGKSKVPKKERVNEEQADTRGKIKEHHEETSRKANPQTAKHTKRKHLALTKSKDKTETGTKLHKNHGRSSKYHIVYHKAKEVTERANKKNSVVIHRPPIIYHPPPEIYHRPDIVVHRAPIVLYRAPIIYHQPPVVVHRPAIVYHQPPIVFHQPPPMVHQPVLHSHDTWVTKSVAVPYASNVHHVATYKGVPHEEIFMHGIGTGAFGKSGVPVKGTRRNSIDQGVNIKRASSKNPHTDFQETHNRTSRDTNESWMSNYSYAPYEEETPQADVQQGAKHRIIRALADQWNIETPEFIENTPTGAGTRMQRSVFDVVPEHAADVIDMYQDYSLPYLQSRDEIPEEPVGAAMRLRRSTDTVLRQYLTLDGSSMDFDASEGAGSRIRRFVEDPRSFYFQDLETQPDYHTHKIGAGLRIQRDVEDPWTTFQETKKTRKSSIGAEHRRRHKGGHKKKKDVVVSRPPIIYHPPPEVYHRPDIVVHRAPILIHRPPIVYHQPPVVVHRPAVVYHQPPIVFHQPAPAVNQPLLYSHDNFVVHPMAFATHMGSVVNEAGHYVGLPHGGVSNFPGNLPHGTAGRIFPTMTQSGWARRTEVEKPKKDLPDDKQSKPSHHKRSTNKKESANHESRKENDRPTEQKAKHTKGERKNKVIVARPPMIYHPPAEIYDRPDIIIHRPDIVIHRPSIVYHQPSVVVHRAAVVYQQPPVVFHQPPPMVKQPVYHAHDTYVAQPVFQPHTSHVSHAATYVGAPHFYPGKNDYGWGLSSHLPTTGGLQTGPTAGFPASGGYALASVPGFGPAFGRSEVLESKKPSKSKDQKTKIKDIDPEKKEGHKRGARSTDTSKRHIIHHKHHHHRHHHYHRHYHHNHLHHRHHIHHGHHHRVGSKREFKLRPISSFSHMGHRKHVVIIHRPPLIYRPPPQVFRQPDILMHLPPIVYHRPPLMFQQPPTIVHHPPIIYHQPPVVFHNPPPIVHTTLIHQRELITPRVQHIMLPTSSYVRPAGRYFGPAVSAPAYGKSIIERANSGDNDSEKSLKDNESKDSHDREKDDRKRDASSSDGEDDTAEKRDTKGSKRQSVGLVVHQPPIVYHPPPDIFDKPPLVVHRPPMIVRRPPILIHRAPVVVHRPPIIIHRPPVILHHPTPVYHVAHANLFHPERFAFGKSAVAERGQKRSKAPKSESSSNVSKKHKTKTKKQHFKVKEGQRKNVVIIQRPAMIYHPPPEIYDRPDVIVHRPDIIVHRPSVVYHQPSVVVHRPAVVYRQPPIVFHQPSPMVHQPIFHAHDTYIAHTVPTPYYTHVYQRGSYVGAPHYFPHGSMVAPLGHAFGKSQVENAKENRSTTKKRRKGNKNFKLHERLARGTSRKLQNKDKTNGNSTSRGDKKNKVIMLRPPLIYHPPAEIYDRPSVILHRPDIIIHRPSIVYHQPSVVVHRAPVIYHQPPVVFHQPPPLVHQPILHAHDTYVANPVPVPYSSSVHHAATYVGSPHHYPGGWGYGWGRPGSAYGKSKVPKGTTDPSKTSAPSKKDKMKREAGAEHNRVGKKTEKKNAKKSHKKNQVIMQRPPLIYHPPPEVYHKPDVIMHRPDIVIHRPSIVYHQPSVVVHRPPVIYRQPPVVFHQPPPLVSQPIMHAHDTYIAHPQFVPYDSSVQRTGNYVGAPQVYPGGWGYGYGSAFGKSKVEKATGAEKKHEKKNEGHDDKGSRRTIQKDDKNTWHKGKSSEENKHLGKDHKKNLVVMRRPPLIYHPPPEIYDKPDIIVHRPDIVIHRPSVVYHQPSVVVNRPPVIYHQPPVVFHQPPPMVRQPIYHAHDTYFAHAHFVPYVSHVQHAASYVGSPQFYPSGWGWERQDYGYGHAFGKSEVETVSKVRNKHKKKDEGKKANRRTLQNTKKDPSSKETAGKNKKPGKDHKKNIVVMRRPPLIYHPPPEIYDKPDIIVHRPDIVIHRPSVVYHQPSVVVHRPPVIYRQPPVVFHQPPPMVRQPIYHAHDTYLANPHFVPYISEVHHAASYVGAPHFYRGGWGWGGLGNGYAFGKSRIEKSSKHHTSRKSKPLDETTSKDSQRALGKPDKTSFTDGKSKNKGHKKNVVIMRRPPLIYHPPPEVYHRPDVVVHRPDIVIHRPSVVFQQPSVVVHRPPVIYHQPPVVFHQPPPMVRQPILHAHDTYFAHPHLVPLMSRVHHSESYVGAPHFFPGGWGWGGHNYGSAFGKSKVQKPSKDQNKRTNNKKQDTVDKADTRTLGNSKNTTLNGTAHDKDNGVTKGHKKNLVIMRRPPLIYHPPPEIYDRPNIVVHRPDIVIHRPSVVFHQPSVVVHRPPVIYHQPPVVFHQPSPMVHQPIFHSHETYLAHPHFVPFTSHVTHEGSYVGAPHFYPSHWGHAFGKSKVEKGGKNDTSTSTNGITMKLEKDVHNNTKRAATDAHNFSDQQDKAAIKEVPFKAFHERNRRNKSSVKGEKSANARTQKQGKKPGKDHKKNTVVIRRPTLVYHPPPEIYDRPSIIVHRPDFVIHQPSVVYHQPSVVVHRPPIIYHPPPVVFHQPPPMVHQPTYMAHDIYHAHPHFVPYVSHIQHAHTYVGAPHFYHGGWRYGYGFPTTPYNRYVATRGWHGWGNAFQQRFWPRFGPYNLPYFAPAHHMAAAVHSANTFHGTLPYAFTKSTVQKHDEGKKKHKEALGHHDKVKQSRKSAPLTNDEVKRSLKESQKKGNSSLHVMKKALYKKGHKHSEGHRKNVVVMRRPPVIYHPPPEIYDRPDVIMHRPDIVIHQPSVVYHQPSVMVHRPPVIYHQPPVVFHQPPPLVHQPIYNAHESYLAHPSFVPYVSHVQHAGTYVGSPEFFHGGWNYGYGHAYGKSDVQKHHAKHKEPYHKSRKKDKIESDHKRKDAKKPVLHPEEEKEENASRKNNIVVSRPPIIYHPPPEIYHRPDIVVHRAPIVLHRPPIIYHQPPVVVHRPAVVYHQPPIVFHQPPPTVTQPILHSHDSFVLRPAARFYPQGSTVTHSMNYVGIPNHVVHGDELSFDNFHRSNIEHRSSLKYSRKSLAPHVTKSTISKIPTTNKENTETTITDQTQKKSFRSRILQAKVTKRQLLGSHSLFGPVSPINDIHYLPTSIEQKEKLSTIPGQNSDRQREISKRSQKESHQPVKRQLILPGTSQYGYPNSLPSAYNALEVAALRNQALAASEELQSAVAADEADLAGVKSALPVLQQNEKAVLETLPFQLPLQPLLGTSPKEESPDVRVHVETAKSSIPNVKSKPRQRRQILPIFPQQVLNPLPRVLYQPAQDIGILHETASPSPYHLVDPYHAIYHPDTGPLNYLPTYAQVPHRPHVNINVQSARSVIPLPEHELDKRSSNSKSKRQLLAIAPPFSRGFPMGLEAAMMNRFLPYSPLAQLMYLNRMSYSLPPHEQPLESLPEEHVLPEPPHFFQPSRYTHNPYNILSQDEGNELSVLNPWAHYLESLYASYYGYSFHHRHHKPKVQIDVHASKSHIPKASESRPNREHSRISKRQLYNYYHVSPLTANHFALPAAIDYGIPGIPSEIRQTSPHVNINVETAKRSGIPSGVRQKRTHKKSSSSKAKNRAGKNDKTGEKRDELVQEDVGTGQEQGRNQFTNAPENQFVATNEAAQPEGTENEQLPAREESIQQPPAQVTSESLPQMMPGPGQVMSEPVQVPEQDQIIQTSPVQSEQIVPPFSSQQAPIQVPMQLPYQTAYMVPSHSPLLLPLQGIEAHTMATAPSVPLSEHVEHISPQEPLHTQEVPQHHTSININVAEKSIVPKRKGTNRKKRQFISLPQRLLPTYMAPNLNTLLPWSYRSNPRVSINVQTSKKSTLEKVDSANYKNKRQSISLLSRFPAEQVLPQTFLQNGVMMPAFNTLPVNHKIKSNGMLLQELNLQKKNRIPKSKDGRETENIRRSKSMENGSSTNKIRAEENVKKSQSYLMLQSPLPVQQYSVAEQEILHPKPHVSVNVQVDKRKSKAGKQEDGNRKNLKRQVYGMDALPRQFPLEPNDHVSANEETSKKKSFKATKQTKLKERRQIYGLSQLPHEGVLGPFSVASQGLALGYEPSSTHNSRVSINVEAKKRSEDDDDDLTEDKRKRQILGIPSAVPVPPSQQGIQPLHSHALSAFQPIVNNLSPEAYQPAEGSIYLPQPVQHEQKLWPASVHAANLIPEQHVQEAPDTIPYVMATHNDHPQVSVHVEASKRGENTKQSQIKKKAVLRGHDTDNNRTGKRRQLLPVAEQAQEDYIVPLRQEDYDPSPENEENAKQQESVLNSERPRVSVHVEVAKKKQRIHYENYLKTKQPEIFQHNIKKRQFIPYTNGANQMPAQGMPLTRLQNQEQPEIANQPVSGEQQADEVPNGQIVLPDQQTQPSVQQVAYFPIQQPQIVPFLPVAQVQPQPILRFPEVQNMVPQEKTPKVSINVQTAKSAISTREEFHKRPHSQINSKWKETPQGRTRRQMFGTVPLLSLLSQPVMSSSQGEQKKVRSTVPQSDENRKRKTRHLVDDRTISNVNQDKNYWKRQLFSNQEDQQEQMRFSNQPLPSDTEANAQQEQQETEEEQPQDPLQTMSDVQQYQQEAGSQALSPQMVYSQQVPLEQYASQLQVPETAPAFQLPHASNPHVNINVQTAKSQVPSSKRKDEKFKRWLSKRLVEARSGNGEQQQGKKVKRQFNILGDDIIERRRGPKFLGAPLKKPRENLFGLEGNFNKPVDVFSTDPISALLNGGGRKRPKMGGIRIDSPTGAGAIPVKETNSLGEALGSVIDTPAVFQPNPAEEVSPLEGGNMLGGDPLPRPGKVTGPQIAALEGGEPNNVPLADLPPRRPEIIPLAATNQAFFPNMPLPVSAPLQERALILAPRIFPIGPLLPLPPPMMVPPTAREQTPEFPQPYPRLGPFLPPVVPMAQSVGPPTIPLSNSESPILDRESEEDKPSVHVNVETSRSHVPDGEQSSKLHTKSPV